MWAFWRREQVGSLEDIHHIGNLIAGLLAMGFESDFFAWQSAVNEDGLAFDVGDAAPFLIQRFDNCGGVILHGRDFTERPCVIKELTLHSSTAQVNFWARNPHPSG